MRSTGQLTRVAELDEVSDGNASAIDVWQHCASLRAPLERRLHEVVGETGGNLADPLRRVIAGGGKRLRPALTLTIALACRPRCDRREAVELATAVELLHTATLVHDDLIDGSAVRRGVATISAREGSASAVIGGDLLIASASLLAAGVSSTAAVVIARTLIELGQGEAAETELRFESAVSPAELMRVTRLKTGSLLRAACQLGAQAARCDANTTDAFGEFGMEFGISLQLIDDILDVVSSPQLAGKPVGADFTAGTMTLPAVLAMRTHPALADLLGIRADAQDLPETLRLLREPENVRAVVATAREHAQAAELQLRTVLRRHPVAAVLREWPMRFLRSQLSQLTDPALHDLLGATADW